MDLLIDVEDLEPSMELSEPVSKDGQFLLPAGRCVKPSDIDRLKEWQVDSVYVKASPTEKIA
jgi:hypothetical protein